MSFSAEPTHLLVDPSAIGTEFCNDAITWRSTVFVCHVSSAAVDLDEASPAGNTS
jgi:hypothetical protein